mgnify:CR=1 FL=1
MTTPSAKTTVEPQYQIQLDTLAELGPVQLGPTASHLWRSDPRHLGFLLARYKFCAKMLAGKSSVLEVGCGDGVGMRVVMQEVGAIHGVDIDPSFVEWATAHARHEGLRCTFSTLDITREAPVGPYDAVYSLDLIEHIPKEQEQTYVRNLAGALKPDGVCIVGTPNVTASAHASRWSVEGHINLQSAESLKKLLLGHFQNVFLFSMNDEVVHSGFYAMAHYLFALAVGRK